MFPFREPAYNSLQNEPMAEYRYTVLFEPAEEGWKVSRKTASRFRQGSLTAEIL